MNTNNTSRNRLNNTIEENESYNKNRVYEIKCSCIVIDMGQTGCKLKIKLREHIRSYEYEKKDSNSQPIC